MGGLTVLRFGGALLLGAGATVFDTRSAMNGERLEVHTGLQPVAAGDIHITPGKRAIGIRVYGEHDLTRMIQPNSRVDVVAISTEGGVQRGDVFLTNVRVLAFGAIRNLRADGKPVEAPVATLEVTPYEARMISAAQMRGPLQLLLRGYGDPPGARDEPGRRASEARALLPRR